MRTPRGPHSGFFFKSGSGSLAGEGESVSQRVSGGEECGSGKSPQREKKKNIF